MAVALYARVSTTRQAEKDLSIPDQLRQMREWCKSQGKVVAAEYVEPGASATDDRRPVFQQMIADATAKPFPFDEIVIHSLSRFFRDSYGFQHYSRKLKRCDVRVTSITQHTTDDPAGEMVRQILSTFDEYQSKENAKHTLRAMKENHRQGHFNGSRPPFGFRVVEVDAKGRRGNKKRIEIDEEEAILVRLVYDMYIQGDRGMPFGYKQIATRMNAEGKLKRGKLWTHQQVEQVLTDPLYYGDHIFNYRDSKTHKVKPESEWVINKVTPIITRETFQRAGTRRQAGSRARTAGEVVHVKTSLLTGVLRCSRCGAGMTLMTGKNGAYRYYRCNTRNSKGNALCGCPNVPMWMMDKAVLESLAEKVFTPKRVEKLVEKLQRRMRRETNLGDGKIKSLAKELKKIEAAQNRLMEAVESGAIDPKDETLAQRSQSLKAKREAILIEIAGNRRLKELPADKLTPKHVHAFTKALKERLLGEDRSYAKAYVHLLVDEIQFNGMEIVMTGSENALLNAAIAGEKGAPGGVLRKGGVWLPGTDSNRRQGG